MFVLSLTCGILLMTSLKLDFRAYILWTNTFALSPIDTADADATQLDSWVASASAVCIGYYRIMQCCCMKQRLCQSTWTWIHQSDRLLSSTWWQSWPERMESLIFLNRRRLMLFVWLAYWDKIPAMMIALSSNFSWEARSRLLYIREVFHREWCLDLHRCRPAAPSEVSVWWMPGMETTWSSISCVKLSRRTMISVRWSCPAYARRLCCGYWVCGKYNCRCLCQSWWVQSQTVMSLFSTTQRFVDRSAVIMTVKTSHDTPTPQPTI